MVRLFQLAIIFSFLSAMFSCVEAESYNLNQMQGSWWASKDDPVAEFAIKGNVLFGDWEGSFICEIKKNMFYVDYGKQSGVIKQKIIKLTKDNLTLQDAEPPYDMHHYFRWDGVSK